MKDVRLIDVDELLNEMITLLEDDSDKAIRIVEEFAEKHMVNNSDDYYVSSGGFGTTFRHLRIYKGL